ncbi:kinetochore Sim4 complex subunit FTA2-domain-containing protein [Nemania abortiva]|nr:kinetochore Sim4 complex subunit FTA2-domain-containing protein [Nemania abortiva]
MDYLKKDSPRRRRPPKPKNPTQRGRPPKKREPKMAAPHHIKHGMSPKKNDRIETPISPLSMCPPPMIHPFKDQDASIEWGERLDTIPGSASEIKAFVFKVKINSEPYVLKVFKFFDPESEKWDWGNLLGNEYPLEKAIFYTDPFYAECRAYGRIKEATDRGEVTGKIATKCRGYIFLNADDQRWLENEGIDLGTEILSDELLPIVGGAGRPRAIVKDFEIAGTDFDKQTPQQIRSSFRNVWLLNKLGIFNRDIRAENFRNGWLVDFDTSYTLPHDIYGALPPSKAIGMQAEDTVDFEEMLKRVGKNIRFLATKKFNFRPRLKKIKYEGSLRVD